MSTEWGYRCLDCDVDTDTWINHGERELSAIIRHWAEIKSITSDPDLVWLTVSWMPGYTFEIFAFLFKHAEHTVVLLNEYDGTKPLEGAT